MRTKQMQHRSYFEGRNTPTPSSYTEHLLEYDNDNDNDNENSFIVMDYIVQ